ncbi:MAG: hypothetical protein NTZ69_15835 [Bacteroidia bacterium]|nr:hypothetical protein [Bacteroidia bacterium]
MSEVISISNAETLQALNRAEIDIQIATAKQYPREINKVLNTIETYATMDVETAEDCFYALRRGSGDDRSVIEGVSVRLAEIFAGAWGNIRVQTRIIGNDGRTITAQGVCHDLETNYAASVEVKRRITNKSGITFSEDMQVVTGNAASAIAFRNAVLKVIPKAVTKKIINNIKQVALGQSIDLETSRQRAVDHFKKIGVTEQQLLEYLEIKSISDIDKEKVFELRSLSNAIKEGTTTVTETFKVKVQETPSDTKKDKAAEKLKEAMKEAKPKTETVNKETGEITQTATEQTAADLSNLGK